jgi:hypothetical protein
MSNNRFSLLGRMLLGAMVASIWSGIQASPRTESELRVTGTYSDMHYIEEAGDLVGTEIKIVFTASKLDALQIAQGPPGELTVADVVAKGNSIQFVIPDENMYAGSFTGTLTNGWLRGKFRFKACAEERVALRPGKSYWD